MKASNKNKQTFKYIKFRYIKGTPQYQKNESTIAHKLIQILKSNFTNFKSKSPKISLTSCVKSHGKFAITVILV